jgi:hypothetical protein
MRVTTCDTCKSSSSPANHGVTVRLRKGSYGTRTMGGPRLHDVATPFRRTLAHLTAQLSKQQYRHDSMQAQRGILGRSAAAAARPLCVLPPSTRNVSCRVTLPAQQHWGSALSSVRARAAKQSSGTSYCAARPQPLALRSTLESKAQ